MLVYGVGEMADKEDAIPVFHRDAFVMVYPPVGDKGDGPSPTPVESLHPLDGVKITWDVRIAS